MPNGDDAGDGATYAVEDAESEDAADAADSTDSADASVPIPCTETATCATAVPLGTIWGGLAGGINEQTQTWGAHSEWYQVTIVQYDPPMGDTIYVDVLLDPLVGVAFDLEVYFVATPGQPGVCSQPLASPTGDAGAAQQVKFSFPNNGAKTLGFVTIHVIAKPGAQCVTGQSYYLDITAE